MNTNKPIIAALIEIIGGYFGLLGLGWMYGGDFFRGILLLVGYWIFLALVAALISFSLGCLGFIFAPIYIAVPIISGIKVYQFANDRWW